MRHILKIIKIIVVFSSIGLACYGFFLLFAPKKITMKVNNSLQDISVKLGIFKKYEPDLFYTSPKHIEKLGIEIIQLSAEEKQKLYSIIKKTIEAGFRYYDTGKNKEIEKVKDLFMIAEYKEIKNDITKTRIKREIWEDYCKIPTEIPEIEFSQTRKYRDLEGRIGIISSMPFTHPDFLGGGCTGERSPHYIFIFNKINNNWKIEKMWPVSIRIEWTEEGIIKNLCS